MQSIITQLNPYIEDQITPYFKELQELGLVHIGHGIIKKGRVPTAIYTHKEWAIKYKEEEYYKSDPLRRYAIKTNFRVITWDSLMVQGKLEKKILEERMRIGSSKQGLLIILKYQNIIETFALGTDSVKLNVSSFLLNHHIKEKLNLISRIHKSILGPILIP